MADRSFSTLPRPARHDLPFAADLFDVEECDDSGFAREHVVEREEDREESGPDGQEAA